MKACDYEWTHFCLQGMKREEIEYTGEELSCSLALSQFAENPFAKGSSPEHQFPVNLFSGNNFAKTSPGVIP